MTEATKRKHDWQEFVSHIEHLQQTQPGDAVSWWPKYVYHYTDVTNACNILRENRILSRQKALEAGAMTNDNASRLVINNTAEERKRFARFYFRPRTPTQYRNEGLRPIADRKIEAHCPVPVFFLLDSREVLTRADTFFTDGNLAAGASLRSTAIEFRELPFDKIYHSRPLSGEPSSTIKYHRNAEVLVPDELVIDRRVLKHIWCRSPAERNTLLYLLNDNAFERWVDRIFQGPKPGLFFGQWTFVREATLSPTQIHLRFNENTRTSGPFEAKVVVTETLTGRKFEWHNGRYHANSALSLTLDPLSHTSDYSVQLYLDGDLAYADRFVDEDAEPF